MINAKSRSCSSKDIFLVWCKMCFLKKDYFCFDLWSRFHRKSQRTPNITPYSPYSKVHKNWELLTTGEKSVKNWEKTCFLEKKILEFCWSSTNETFHFCLSTDTHLFVSCCSSKYFVFPVERYPIIGRTHMQLVCSLACSNSAKFNVGS